MDRAKQSASSVSRPLYPLGSTRMRRWKGQGDVRAYAPPAGWTAVADLIDTHPIHGTPLPGSQWWIFETKQ
ncbi:hypothetical protein V8U11_08170 [Pseudomonas chlororaphis]